MVVSGTSVGRRTELQREVARLVKSSLPILAYPGSIIGPPTGRTGRNAQGPGRDFSAEGSIIRRLLSIQLVPIEHGIAAWYCCSVHRSDISPGLDGTGCNLIDCAGLICPLQCSRYARSCSDDECIPAGQSRASGANLEPLTRAQPRRQRREYLPQSSRAKNLTQ